MIAGKHNFTADEGTTFTFRVEIRDDAGELMDLTGWTGQFGAATSSDLSTIVVVGDVVVDASGIEVTIPPDAWGGSGIFIYDLQIAKDDVVFGVLFGSLTVRVSVFA